jgi:hypothetical protein
VVNPYGVYTSLIEVPEKVFLKSQERLWKVRAISRLKPNAILLGSSRTRDGLDEKDDYFADGNNWFNSAVNGGNIYEMCHFYEHASSIKKLDKMLLGVDFFMFNAYHKGRNFLPKYFFLKGNSRWDRFPDKQVVSQLISSLISMDALTDSWNTLKGKTFAEHKQLQEESNGFMKQEYTKVHEILSFPSMEEAFLKDFWFPEPENQFSFERSNGYRPFDYYQKILQAAYENGTQTTIFISPSHARLWENLYQVGLWDKWKGWKEELVFINENLAKKYKKDAFIIIDFSGFHDYSTETLPNPLQVIEEDMIYYTDSSHYRFALGREILKVIHSVENKNPIDSDWYRIIDSNNIGTHLSKIEEERKLFEKKNPAIVEDIRQQVNKTRFYRKGSSK